ncbi:MAG TPA: hypothetical protein VMO00_16190 [Methylomirabilota bacterium]|nr:hypothetical protein [Methylomirabilota bacterium]
MKADSTGLCGGSSITLPFSDVMGNIFFCQIAEAYFSGLTNGTTSTTYSPSANVPREQMAAFVTRTMDQSLRRGSRQAALDQFWTPQNINGVGVTTIGASPFQMSFDGADLWVAVSGQVARVRASDSKLLETWTNATGATNLIPVKGSIFVGGNSLYLIDPTQPAGPVAMIDNLPTPAHGIAYDGRFIWTANAAFSGTGGSVSSVNVYPPYTISHGFVGFTSPEGILFDGSNIWVTDLGDDKLKQLDSSGNIIRSVSVGDAPGHAAFDGTNIWVPNQVGGGTGTISVVRATGALAGTVLATLSGNGLSDPLQVAFDGERMLATNAAAGVSLWRASDLTPLGSCDLGTNVMPYGATSDGLHFWVTLNSAGKLVRF